MGRRRKNSPQARILALATSGLLLAASFSPFVDAQERDRAEEQADDAKEIAGAKTRSKPGFLVAPIPVSEPVLGTGLALAGMMFYQPRGAGPHGSHAALLGGATSNGSWTVGGLNSMKLKNDTLRIETLIGYGSFNEKYFGVGGDLNPGIDYNQKKFVFEVEPRFRIKSSNWFAGVEYRFDSTQTTLIDAVPAAERDDGAPTDGTRRVAGLTGVVAFDSRTNLYQAKDGRLFEVYIGTFQPWLGSTDAFNKGKLEYRQFAALTDRLVIGGRGRSEFVDGDDAPFFEQPYLELRGYARGEIRDDVTLWAETEARYDLFWRIGVAAFGGLGWAGETFSELLDDKARVAGGFGLRYALRPGDGLRIGIDMAWSPDNKGLFYLRVGESF